VIAATFCNSASADNIPSQQRVRTLERRSFAVRPVFKRLETKPQRGFSKSNHIEGFQNQTTARVFKIKPQQRFSKSNHSEGFPKIEFDTCSEPARRPARVPRLPNFPK
jgi:hypothetical protein